MKREIKKKIAMALTFAMVANVPAINVNADAEQANQSKSIQVNVAAQAEYQFIVAPQTITVDEDKAESYGYADKVTGGVSVLDVVVTMNEDMFGADFISNPTDYLQISDGGFTTVIFGLDATNMMYSVNGKQPNDGVISDYGSYTGYTIDMAQVNENDIVDIYFIQDPYYCDNITWFEGLDDTVSVGEDIALALKGYNYCYYGSSPQDMIDEMTTPIEDAIIGIADEYGNITTLDVVTDENGGATIRFAEAGTYTLVAYTDIEDEYVTPIFMPIKTVTVTEDITTSEKVTTEDITTSEAVTTEDITTSEAVTTEDITTSEEVTTETTTTSEKITTTEKATTSTTQNITTKAPQTTQKATTRTSKPATVKIAKVYPKKKTAKKIKLTLKKKVAGAKGYVVNVYKTSKAAKANKGAIAKFTIKKNVKTFTITGSKLTKKNTLYVKVKAYKVVKGKKYYSDRWSNAVKVKVSR